MPISFIVKKGVVPPEETWYEATDVSYWGDPEEGSFDYDNEEWIEGGGAPVE